MRTAEKIFNSVVKGSNCFTPRLVAYYKIDDNSAIELSTVSNSLRKGITESGFMESGYGVTVVIDNKHDTDKGGFFQTREQANEVINSFNPIQKESYVRINAYGDSKLEIEKL